MAEESSQTVVAALTGSILPPVRGLTDRLESGIDVLDLGCGRALNHMARAHPNSRFTGYDISEKGVARAGEEAAKASPTSASRLRTSQACKSGTPKISSPPST